MPQDVVLARRFLYFAESRRSNLRCRTYSQQKLLLIRLDAGSQRFTSIVFDKLAAFNTLNTYSQFGCQSLTVFLPLRGVYGVMKAQHCHPYRHSLIIGSPKPNQLMYPFAPQLVSSHHIPSPLYLHSLSRLNLLYHFLYTRDCSLQYLYL